MAIGDTLFLSAKQTLRFRDPVEVVTVSDINEVVAALDRVESAVINGLFAAGFVSYEAAPAFDPALSAHPPTDLPLVWFAFYRECGGGPIERPGSADFEIGPWKPLVSSEEYSIAIAHIHDWIASGDTYQVNYTFPMRATFDGDPSAWFHQLCQAQQSSYCAYLDTGRFHILSVSPELFFRLDDDRIEMRPMKGTRRRGLYLQADELAAQDLLASEKERAENLMIVDLIRNDLGRISAAGQVSVPDLFRVERYETVWQMTSSVVARTQASMGQIFGALFPSGSVTGAPKVRTMQIIRELEPFPRGVYCGSVGWLKPGREAEFNVAIRTVVVDTSIHAAEYHVGGGITWDSTEDAEFDECMAKAAILTYRRPMFELLESLRFEGEYFLLEEHMNRLRASADYFGFRFEYAKVLAQLMTKAQELAKPNAAWKVRLLLAHDGSTRIEASPAPAAAPVRVGFAREPISQDDVFLYHKTTARGLYDQARASRPDCDDVILWNTRGEITETTTANIVADIDGELVTPPVSCGLLAGTLRARLLAKGEINERILTKTDLQHARSIHLINSVRQWINAALQEPVE